MVFGFTGPIDNLQLFDCVHAEEHAIVLDVVGSIPRMLQAVLDGVDYFEQNKNLLDKKNTPFKLFRGQSPKQKDWYLMIFILL